MHVLEDKGTCKLRNEQNVVRRVGSDVMTAADLEFLRAKLGKQCVGMLIRKHMQSWEKVGASQHVRKYAFNSSHRMKPSYEAFI